MRARSIPRSCTGTCLTAAGELATFTTTAKRPPTVPRRTATIGCANRSSRSSPSLRASLSVVLEQNAIAIPLRVEEVRDQRGHRFRSGRLFGSAVFILAARADVPAEELRRRFPAQLKIGPVEKIRDLVTLQLPGVPVAAVPVAPRQIPFHAGFAYFELDQTQRAVGTAQDLGRPRPARRRRVSRAGDGVLGDPQLMRD